jgi:hypothetical protein
MDVGSVPIGFDRFSIRMGWKWVGIDGKGYRNTTYISESIPTSPNLDFGLFVFVILCFSCVWEPQTVFL